MFKRIFALFLALCILSCVPIASAVPDDPMWEPNEDSVPFRFEHDEEDALFAPDRVIVKTKPAGMVMFSATSGAGGPESGFDFGGLEIVEIESLDMKPAGQQEVFFSPAAEALSASETLLLTLKNPGERNVIDAVRLLNSLPNIEVAEPDYIVKANFNPDDPFPNDPYYDQLYGMDLISAPDVWAMDIDCSSIVVAVIDTGIDIKHPCFHRCCAGYIYRTRH